MESESKSWITIVEASNKNGRRDDKEEDEGSNDSMANDETVVLRECGKATGHACMGIKSQVYIGTGQVWAISLFNCIVAKFSPWRLGRRKVFLVESHVPSPTNMVLES